MDDFFDSHEARDAKVRADNARDAKAAKDAEARADAELKAGAAKEVPVKEALVDAPPLVSTPPKSSEASDEDDSDAPDDANDNGEADDSSDSEDASGDTPQPRPKRVPKRKTRGFVEVKKPDKGKKNSNPAKKTRDDIDDEDEDADDRKRKTRDNRKASLDSQLRENQVRDKRNRDSKREEADEEEEFDEDYEDPDYDDKFAVRIFDAEDQNFIQKYFSFVQGVLFNPKKFFAAMPPEGLMAPTIFLGISAGIYSFFQALGHLDKLFTGPTTFFSSMILTAGGAVIVWALFNKACKGHGTFAQTYKVLAYSKATLLFAWIVAGTMPLGGYLSVAYTLFLNYIGLRKVHRLNAFMTAGITLLLGVLAMELKKMLPF